MRHSRVPSNVHCNDFNHLIGSLLFISLLGPNHFLEYFMPLPVLGRPYHGCQIISHAPSPSVLPSILRCTRSSLHPYACVPSSPFSLVPATKQCNACLRRLVLLRPPRPPPLSRPCVIVCVTDNVVAQTEEKLVWS